MSGPYQNTDKELWREREGDHYADSIHVTVTGCIGINCGGPAAPSGRKGA